MKVWINKRYGDDYTGGMIIVAANSAKEAHETLHNDPSYTYLYRQKADGSYRDYHYAAEDWEEIPLLTYNGDKPCVIDEAGYSDY